MRIIVLGAGRVGAAMARDLAADEAFDVTVADRDPNRLEWLESSFGIRGERFDASVSSTVGRAIADADLVISAVPGFLGHRTLATILEAGKSVVDIAFFPEDPFTLDEPAKRMQATAIVDCGVAPGLSNLLVGHAVGDLDRADRVEIYVGGLPADPQPPYEYRAVFSPIDVIEEYTRPARFIHEGRLVTKPALTDIEELDFPVVGRLEAFITDGLRTLMQTIDCPEMIEKTLRYPGHAEKMQLLRETGFFSEAPIEIDGREIRPIDVSTALLFPLWQLREGEEDITVLRVIVEGEKDGDRLCRTFDLVDRLNRPSGVTSMARTTGYMATVAARFLASGGVPESGIFAPEMLAGIPGAVDFILSGLRQRGIAIEETVS